MTKRTLTSRLVILLPAMIALVALIGGATHLASAQKQAAEAAESLRICHQLSTEVQQLSQRAQHTSLVSRSLADLANLVESAAKDAGLASDSIVRIDPQAVRRIGDTDYQELATAVELLAATLPQLKAVVAGITARDSNLEVRTIRLKSPHDVPSEESAETWSVDMLLTQRIYAPKTSRP